MDKNANSPSTILAFVSGKGGVGKTLLAVAAAHESSQSQNTLVLDLDFFNRGLSGLLSGPGSGRFVPGPSFLPGFESKPEFEVRQVDEHLFTVVFPEMSPNDLERLAEFDVSLLAQNLQGWIEKLCSRLDCRVVILDCHGGPDRLSFASVLVAHAAMVVSEPDRITMHGTLHFLRRLEELSSARSNIYLVFNKVGKAFSARYLNDTYNEYLQDYFGHKALLALFPVEDYFAHYFEQKPFLTEYFPLSMLARKVKIMLGELGDDLDSYELSRSTVRVPRVLRSLWKRSLGRRPALLSTEFALTVVYITSFLVLCSVVFAIWLELEFLALIVVGMLVPLVIASPIWVSLCIVLTWTKTIDHKLSISLLRKKWLPFVGYTLVLATVWISFGSTMVYLLYLEAMVTTGLASAIDLVSEGSVVASLASIAMYGVSGLFLCVVMAQLFRIYCDFKFTFQDISAVAKCLCWLVTAVIVVEVFLLMEEVADYVEGLLSRS